MLDGDQPDHALFKLLHTEYTLDDALYLRELQEIGISRSHARAKNEEALRALDQ